MGRQWAVFMTAGVLGVGLAGCGGCDCDGAVAGSGSGSGAAVTPRAEACNAIANLSANLEPVTMVRPTTSPQELMKLRDDVERDSPKVIEKRGMVQEDLRVDLSAARKEFVTAVNSFGSATSTIGSAAPRLNEQYQAVRGTVRALKVNTDCSRPNG